MSILYQKAREYAENVLNGSIKTTWEVKKQCEWFINDVDNRQHDDEFPYYFDDSKLEGIDAILSVITFATGFSAGQTLISTLSGFQCFFLANVFGFRFKSDPDRFRYRDNTLWIPRKNGKTFLCALVILILMLTEPNYSEFYSISKDRELAGETKKALTQLITECTALTKHFTTPTTLHGKMKCLVTNSYYQARTSEANSNNGIRPSAIICDEMGAFTTTENYQAMKSGQLSVKNPLRFKLTTAYAVDGSIFLEEIEYIRKVYNGLIEDERMFALLYYAPESELWTDLGLEMANPLFTDVPQNMEEVKDARAEAIEKPLSRVEFLTKHVNHFMSDMSGEAYVDINDVRKGKLKNDPEWWRGRQVWCALDLAMTTDNCAFAMSTEEDLKIYSDVFGFAPEDRIDEKSRLEKVQYRQLMRTEGKFFGCGDLTVDYGFIENFILSVEKKYGVTVMGLAFDRYNCLSTAQRIERESYIPVIETKQHSSVLHMATKLLQEKIVAGEFFYFENTLLEHNFVNSRVVLDNNLNMYVNKKKSAGRVDMVVALINSIYILQNDVVFNPEKDWGGMVF